MRLSVVILTYNGARWLTRIVASLVEQALRNGVELLAVDSGSTDGTVEILRNNGFRVFSIPRNKFEFGRVRDYAFSLSSGDIIVTQSQDVIPMDQTYLQALSAPIIDGEADVVQGITISSTEIENSFIWHADRTIFYFTSEGKCFFEKNGGIGLSSECMAISRKAWESTGFGQAPYCEDKLIQGKLHSLGYRIVATKHPIAWHNHNYDLFGVVIRCLNEGCGWRYAGVSYFFLSCLYDLSVGFWRHRKLWWKMVRSGTGRSVASIGFFQIRPIALYIGNRLLSRIVLR